MQPLSVLKCKTVCTRGPEVLLALSDESPIVFLKGHGA